MKTAKFDFPDFELTRTSVNDLFLNLPTWAGNSMLNFFLDSWKKEGFTDREFKAWKKRRHKINGKRRNILVGKGSGALRRSLRLRIGSDYFEIYSNMPYAKIHNECGEITQQLTERQKKYFWSQFYYFRKRGDTKKANMFKRMALSDEINISIPKRQFMGKSERFNSELIKYVEHGLKNAIDN